MELLLFYGLLWLCSFLTLHLVGVFWAYVTIVTLKTCKELLWGTYSRAQRLFGSSLVIMLNIIERQGLCSQRLCIQ